jgi:hypothetical protein
MLTISTQPIRTNVETAMMSLRPHSIRMSPHTMFYSKNDHWWTPRFRSEEDSFVFQRSVFRRVLVRLTSPGGGLVGLSAATFLAHQGIRSVTIERLRASSPLPRAAFFHMRTLEMFRTVGIESRVREQSAQDFVPEGAINTVGDPQLDSQAAANAATDISESRLIDLVRAGVGNPSLAVRIDGYTRWRATANVARRFQDKRIFITGDAAHLMPPNGGFGGNTGIHDAHNLAWKITLVIRGQASANLLDTYAMERKPVAQFTVEQAFSRYVTRTAPWLESSQQPEALVDDLKIELGYLYNSPIGIHADPRTTLAAAQQESVILDDLPQHHSVVDADVPGGIQKGYWLSLGALPQSFQRLGVFMKFPQVASAKLGPPKRIVAKPFSQLRARCPLAHPRVNGGRFLFDSARPQAVHEHAESIGLLRLIINSLDADIRLA